MRRTVSLGAITAASQAVPLLGQPSVAVTKCPDHVHRHPSRLIGRVTCRVRGTVRDPADRGSPAQAERAGLARADTDGQGRRQKVRELGALNLTFMLKFTPLPQCYLLFLSSLKTTFSSFFSLS